MNKEIMLKLGFSKEVERIEKGRCPLCAKKIKKDEFIDELSQKEFEISGMCQACQNEVFVASK